MRVLLTTPYDLAVPGGVNRHALDLLDALTRRGIEARLVGPSSSIEMSADARIVHLGQVRVQTMNGAQSRVTLDGRIGGEVRALLREFRPEVIHLQEPFLPVLNTFCLWHAGPAACVGTFHTYSEKSRGYLWAWPYCRWVNGRLRARIAVSVPAREFAAEFHPGDYQIVPNGVRLPPPARLRPARPLGRPVRLVFVGRSDEPRKGFGVLIEALRILESATPGAFALQVAGPGAAAWAGAADGLPVTLAGQLTDHELSAAYAAADVCVLPSVGGESFGLVALEALAHGVPVVASRIRGYAEWLKDADAGALFAPGDPEALAAALRAVAADPARHGEQARRAPAVAAPFGWDAVVERVLGVYASARSKVLGRG